MTKRITSEEEIISAQERPVKKSLAIPAFCNCAFFFFLGGLTHVLEPSEGGGGNTWLYPFLALTLQVGSFIILMRPGRRERFINLLSNNKSLVLAVFIIAISPLWSIDPMLSTKKIIALIGTTCVAILIYIENEKNGVIQFITKNLAIFTLLSIALAIFLPALGTHPTGRFAGQWRGLVGFKNQAAWLACLFLLFLAGTEKAGWIGRFRHVLFAAGLLMLIRTGSATGVAALAFAGISYLSVTAFRTARSLRVFMVTAVAFAVLALLSDPQGYFEYVLEMLGRDSSLTGRTSIWKALVPIIDDNLWLGVGYLAFWDHAATYFGNTSWMADIGHAHNAYIEILLDVGIIGLITQCLFIFSRIYYLFVLVLRGDKVSGLLLCVMLTFSVIGVAGALFFRANTGIWIITVIITCYVADSNERLRRNQVGRALLRETVWLKSPSVHG